MLWGQNANSLLQIISSNSLLEREPEIRSVQYDLATKITRIKPGLNSELPGNYVDSLVKTLKEKLDIIDSIVVKVKLGNKTDNIIIDYSSKKISGNVSFSIKLTGNKVNLKAVIDSAGSSFQKMLKINIDVLFKNNNYNLFQDVFALNFIKLTDENYSLDSDLTNKDNSYSYGISKIVSEFIVSTANNYLKDHNIDNNIDLNDLENKCNEIIKNALSPEMIKLKNKLKVNLDKVNYEVTKTLNSISKWLMNGNMGLAFSKEEGSMGGGFQILYSIGKNFQIGAFANGLFNVVHDSSNNKTAPIAILGAQLRTSLCKHWQLDAVGSYIIGPSDARDKDREIGFGISTNLPGIILGTAFFYNEKRIENLPIFISKVFGLSFKSLSPASPTLILQFVFPNEGKMTPTFQISYPIQLLN